MSVIRSFTLLSLATAAALAAAALAPAEAQAATCPLLPSDIPAVSFSGLPPTGGGVGARQEAGKLVYVSGGTLRVDIDAPTHAYLSTVQADGRVLPAPNFDSDGWTAQIVNQGIPNAECRSRLTVNIGLINRHAGKSTPISITVNGFDGGSTAVTFTLVEVAAIDAPARYTLGAAHLRNRLVNALHSRFLTGSERIGRVYSPSLNLDLALNEGSGHLGLQVKYDIPDRVDQWISVSGSFTINTSGRVVWNSAPSVGLEYWPLGNIPVFNYTALRDEVRGFVDSVIAREIESAVSDALNAAFAFQLVDHVEIHEGQIAVVLGALTTYTVEVPYDPSRLDIDRFGMLLPPFDAWVAVASGISTVFEPGPFQPVPNNVDPHGLPSQANTLPGWDANLGPSILAARERYFGNISRVDRGVDTLPFTDDPTGALIAIIDGQWTRSLANPCHLGNGFPHARRAAFSVNDIPGQSSGRYSVTLVKWPFGGAACPAPHPHMFGGNRQEWQMLWGVLGFLGDALDIERVEADGRGILQRFAGGDVVWTSDTGSWALHGSIRAKWLLARGASQVGYPTSDEIKNPDGVGITQRFERGAMYWHPSIGNSTSFQVINGIYARYVQLGEQAGIMGYPTSDETYDGNGGAMNDFQRGALVWSNPNGIRVLGLAIRDRWRSGGGSRAFGFPTTDEAPLPGAPGWRFVQFERARIITHPTAGTFVQ